MVCETIQPLVKELPKSEQRRLLKWLKEEVEDVPVKVVNHKLRQKLIKHITKKATRQSGNL
jgi:hypothetical protein